VRNSFFKIKYLSKLKILLVALVLLTVLLSLFGFISLRYKQLCSYQNMISSGVFEADTNLNLCPNVLDSSNYSTIIANAFKFNILDGLVINSNNEGVFINISDVECNPDKDLICWIKQMGETLQSTDGFTNFLLAVSDNRFENGSLWGNTDSILLISHDNITGKILMVSFPRDLYATYHSHNGIVSSKINSIYAMNGRETLKSAITEITGIEIHYSAVIGFNLFNQLIDKLGGIDIYLDEPFQDLYPCSEVPLERNNNCIGDFGWFTFPQGWNHFDSFSATVYARARYASSDYSRASRQQDLIKAIIKNALSKDISLVERFNLYSDIYQTLESMVETDVETKDLAGFISFFENLTDDAASIVLDPSVSNKQLIYEYGISEVGWVTKFYDYTYQDVKAYISSVRDNLTYYIEKPKIKLLNTTNKQISNLSIKKLIENHSIEINISNNSQLNFSGVRIYDLSGNKKAASVQQLLIDIPEALLYSPELDELSQSEWGEDILIVIGK
jgi:LCP family protein required for cell wall assembly